MVRLSVAHAEERPPTALPPWFRWGVGLAVLVAVRPVGATIYAVTTFMEVLVSDSERSRWARKSQNTGGASARAEKCHRLLWWVRHPRTV